MQDATGAISIRLDNSEATVQSTQTVFHKDITVSGNTIKNFLGCAINLGNVDGAVITDNTVELNVNEHRFNGECGIKVSYCENATVTGNRLSNAMGDVWEPVVLHHNVTVTATDNDYVSGR